MEKNGPNHRQPEISVKKKTYEKARYWDTASVGDLNHLEDISVSDDFACLLGYSEEEIKTCYADYLKKLEDKLELMGKIRLWYNGYSPSASPESAGREN